MHYYVSLTYTIHMSVLYYKCNVCAIKYEHTFFFYILAVFYTYFGLEALLTEDGHELFCIQN